MVLTRAMRSVLTVLSLLIRTTGHTRQIEDFTLTRPDGSLINHYLVYPDGASSTPPPGEESGCPEAYLQNKTISQRVLDVLQVTALLQRSAAWWNGKTVLWGGSEGGMVASYAALLSPSVARRLAESLNSSKVTYREFPGLDHFYEDAEGNSHREQVIEYQRAWLNTLLADD